MEFCRAKNDFINGYFSTNERQIKTKAAYISDLSQFEDFVGVGIDISYLCSSYIEKWAAFLKAKSYSPASIRRKLVVLKVFFGYWVRNGLLAESPFWRVKISVGKIRQLPRTLTEEEMRGLLEQAHRGTQNKPKGSEKRAMRPSSKEFLTLRNKTIIELLFATGIRVAELSSIDLSDFVSDEAAFRIRGKGGKERMVFIVDAVTAHTHINYLVARISLETDSGAMFVNASGDRLSPQGIANVVCGIQRMSSIARHVTPHMLRHTVATMLLRNGTDIRVVQEFLGHASIATTQRYTHIAKEHLINELQAKHPSLSLRVAPNLRSQTF